MCKNMESFRVIRCSPFFNSIYFLQNNLKVANKVTTLRQELFGLTILSVFYLVHNGFNLSYMAQLEMVLTK